MKKKILILFGNRVKQCRKNLHVSQEAFAEKTGLHRTYMGMIERAEKNITLENILKISQGLNLLLSELFKNIDI